MHKLLAYQLRTLTGADGELKVDAFIATVKQTYEEFDRERRLNDRAGRLMEEELKAANESVRRHGERRLAETLENAPCALALLDSGLRVQTVNPSMLALCGVGTAEEACGMGVRELFARTGGDGGELAARLLGGEPVEIQRDGRWHLGAAAQLSDGSYTMSFSDITALKEREEVLALAKDAAEAANRVKSQFLAVMSHELRTPLNAILGFSEVIRDAVLGTQEVAWARYSDYAASIHESGRHLLSLISEILDLSKIESGSYQLHPEPCDVGALLRDAWGLVAPQALKNQVSLLPFKTPGDLHAAADRRAVKQVVLNLLSNAVKFTPPGGEVALRVEARGGNIVVEVRDTGIGIAPEHIDLVFQPFHQGEAKISRQYQGTGLGLPISRALMQMHGGDVTLKSERGVGTVATMILPRNAAARAAQAA